jgi:hypothetical protein
MAGFLSFRCLVLHCNRFYLNRVQGLRVYEQHGRLLASFQDQLSDAVQGQLQALFQSLVSSFLAAAKIKVRPGRLQQQQGLTRRRTIGDTVGSTLLTLMSHATTDDMPVIAMLC